MPNRDQYEGDYRDGFRHGRGIYQYKNSARYEGEWKRGLKHGFGKLNYPDGSWYCGDWKEGKKHGFGKYSYENGDYYEGTWKEGVKHSVGNFNFNEAGIFIRATWIDGNLKGPIEIFYPNIRYHGYWKIDRPIGEGVFSYDLKYMLTGHVAMVPNPLYQRNSNISSENSEEAEKTSDSPVPRCVPVFVPHEIQRYDVSKLPQHPLPLPQEDSVASFCSQGSASSREDIFKVRSPMMIAAGSISETQSNFGPWMNQGASICSNIDMEALCRESGKCVKTAGPEENYSEAVQEMKP